MAVAFPEDLRVEDASRLLNFENVPRIRPSEDMENQRYHIPLYQQIFHPCSEDQLRARHILLMKAALWQTFASVCGRSLVDYGIFPEGVNTSTIPIPIFDVGTMLFNGHSINTDESILVESREWPDFHRGVATGLKLGRQSDIDGSWIVFNRYAEPNAEHAGFLLAMGLQGHLKKLSHFHAFEYLQAKHDLTSVGLLLGMAANYCGAMDETIGKLISIHIPSLLPSNATDLNLSSSIQSAALVSYGLLYMGTLHRRTAEILLKEIGRRDLFVSDAHVAYRESYSLSAGFALGFVTLGQGPEARGLADLRIVDELLRLIYGGRTNSNVSMTNRLSHNRDIQTYRFDDGSAINVNVTAPGALVALSLMYLKTNSEDIANHLKLPSSWNELDMLRPDILLLRVVGYNLILWDRIEASENWLRSMVPFCVYERSAFSELGPIIAGASLVLALKFAGTNDDRAVSLLLKQLDSMVQRISSSG